MRMWSMHQPGKRKNSVDNVTNSEVTEGESISESGNGVIRGTESSACPRTSLSRATAYLSVTVLVGEEAWRKPSRPVAEWA